MERKLQLPKVWPVSPYVLLYSLLDSFYPSKNNNKEEPSPKRACSLVRFTEEQAAIGFGRTLRPLEGRPAAAPIIGLDPDLNSESRKTVKLSRQVL